MWSLLRVSSTYLTLGIVVILIHRSSGGLSGSPQDNHIRVEQPLTFGAALQQEVERLQGLSDVFPPKNLSYYIPYGDRSIVSLQFHDMNDLSSPSGWGPPPPSFSYGPPPNHSKKKLKKPQDFGVIMTQSHIYRENVRAIGDFAKLFKHSKPTQDILRDVGKILAVKQKLKKSGKDNPVLKQINKDIAQGTSGSPGWGWTPPPPPPPPEPSFVLACIESRAKLSPEHKDDGSSSHTNGSLIFPSPKNPDVLVFVPFILRKEGDVKDVFRGYEDDMKGLLPRDRETILSFLKLIEGVHSDSHGDAKERMIKVKKMSDTLQRPKLPRSLFEDDPLEEAEDKARQTYWLHTSTVAIRKLTPMPPELLLLLTPVVYEVPLTPVVHHHVPWVNPPPLVSHYGGVSYGGGPGRSLYQGYSSAVNHHPGTQSEVYVQYKTIKE